LADFNSGLAAFENTHVGMCGVNSGKVCWRETYLTAYALLLQPRNAAGSNSTEDGQFYRLRFAYCNPRIPANPGT
jgi:hypothetical protein